MKTILLGLLLTIFTTTVFAQVSVKPALKIGDIAPDFEINDTTGAKVKLSSFRGKKNVVLAFYVFAFTGG